MIYAADVVSAANVAFGAAMLMAAISVPTCWVMNQWQRDFGDDAKVVRVPYAKVMMVAFAAAMLTVFTPSSSTIYAIAASEMGEEVLNSETASKAMQALDAWLDRQIGGEDATNAN